MAWTDPGTVTVAQLVDAAYMNTTLRDNLNALSTHQHSGAAGDGSQTLSGPDSVEFDDIADPAAPGQFATIIYTNAGKLHQRAGLAGSAEELSVEGHTH